jgi:PPOX class probable F420-dependent enzyme
VTTESTAPARPASLASHIRAFLESAHVVALSTIDPDGAPRQAVVWYLLEDDTIVVNSLVGRRWPSNLARDPRVSLAIIDEEDGLRWVGITGIAEAVEDQPTAQADIAAMARRYNADDPREAERLIRERFEPQQRISFRIRIDAVHDHLS